jgi:hypothetical protein
MVIDVAPLTTATGIALTGPATAVQGALLQLSVAPTPAGSSFAAATTVTLGDNLGGNFWPASLSFAAGATAAQTLVYQPTVAGNAVVTATSTLGTSSLAITVTPYDSVHHRLMLAVKQVVLELGLKDIPSVGAGIPNEYILDGLVPSPDHKGLPGISINLRGSTVTLADLTMNYSEVLLPDVPLIGYLVTRPVQIDILDATDENWQERYPLWLLWLERLQRRFLQPNIVTYLVGGCNGAVATVPEFSEGNLFVVPDPVIDEAHHKYQQYKTGLRLNCECSEATFW